MMSITVEAERPARNYLQDLWRFRELFLFITWRDFLVRYKQTFAGVAWAVLKPLLSMVVMTLVFGDFAGMKADSTTAYAVIVYCGLLPWNFFSQALSDASLSLVNNAKLVGKVYFPRVILPFSNIVVNLIDFAISFAILIGLMIFYGVPITWKLLLLPLFLLQASVLCVGIGLAVSALNVFYRDFKFIMPFFIQLGMFITPVGYATASVLEKIPAWAVPIYYANPLVGVVDGFRWAILGDSELYAIGYTVSVVLCLAIFFAGVRFFLWSEKKFADVI